MQLAAGLIAWAVMGRLLAPIARLREAAESIGEDELARRIPVRGRDDLS
ncbi:MAG: HAMP domain-containing protein, partial [Planctomycetes bacterium]|nr:HAMP domain-containing protein [Planctomycetota bacterium]